MDEFSEATAATGNSALVPVEIEGHTVYFSVQEMGDALLGSREEREIADRRPRLETVLGGVANFAKQIVGSLNETGASKVSVEFGCEFALESGTFIAVIGKASAKSTLKIGLEWAKPES